MKIKNSFCIYTVAIMGFALALVSSCKTKDDNSNPTPIEITDVDGNIYHTVTIGTQVWMVENLRVTKFNNGNEINFVFLKQSNRDWPTPHYCWYDNNSANKNISGALYNYRVVHPQSLGSDQITPKGWHVPSDEEWNKLISYLGGVSVAGGKMKSTGSGVGGTGLWNSPNTSATNESGFTALPGGICSDLNGFFSGLAGFQGFWWSSTYTQRSPSSYILNTDNASVTHEYESIAFNSDFRSIRCVKD